MQSAEAIIHFELKYCERCGGLWLRRCGVAAVYCSPCARQMAGLSQGRPRPETSRANSGIAGVSACVLACLQPWLEMAAESLR